MSNELYFEVGIGTRMRRLIELLTNGMEKVYAEQDIEFRTGHFYALYAVVERGPLTINEIAGLAGFSQSAVSQTVKRLVALDILEARPTEDARQKCIHLTENGQRMVEKLRPTWTAIEAVVKDAIKEGGVDFLAAISGMEKAFRRQSVYDRLRAKMSTPLKKAQFDILPYHVRWRDEFKNLNLWWMEKYFRVEPVDEQILSDPEGDILDHGGEIFFAVADDKALGTVALKNHGGGVFELTKLGVTPEVQQGGLGRALCETVIERFTARGGKTLFLETNTVLTPAITLYEKLGFVERPFPTESPYERANYYMEWEAK